MNEREMLARLDAIVGLAEERLARLAHYPQREQMELTTEEVRHYIDYNEATLGIEVLLENFDEFDFPLTAELQRRLFEMCRVMRISRERYRHLTRKGDKGK